MLNKNQHFNLINAANITSGILKSHFVQSHAEMKEYQDNLIGLPILLAADSNIFRFSREHIFQVNQLELCRTVYGHDDLSYVGFKHAYPANLFLSDFEVKSEFKNHFSAIVDQNLNCIKKIQELKSKHIRVGAFQTRNIPHSGHEAIINAMLERCDHVVINPVVGPKKKGDIALQVLQDVFDYLALKKYKNLISFIPIMANMFYAGPREAVHHSLIREELGFDLFSVGRDHAGAENKYEAAAAVRYIELQSHKLKIKVMTHKGAAYCSKCDKVLIKGSCKCDECYIIDIAGTDFRNSLHQQKIYDFADEGMQKYIFCNDIKVFEN